MLRRVARILILIVIVLAIVFGILTGYVVYTIRRPLPQSSGTLALQGLKGEVRVYRDADGIPHIYASTPEDLFFAQGVIHAQDRWWQMEFNRHIGLGRISELTGNNDSARRNDIFIRTVGWNRAAQQDLDMGAREGETTTLDALNAYANGVNAYLEGKSSSDLALEYSVLAVRGINIPIERWEALHSVAWGKVMAWDLSGNYDTELTIASLYKSVETDPNFGLDKAGIDKYIYPAYPETHPTVLKADEISVEPDPVTAYRAPLVAPGTDFKRVQTTLVGGVSANFSPFGDRGVGLGSNNWVIGGSRTQSGKPLVADDPHLGIRMPSIWYQVGLHCIEVSPQCPYDVQGFSFPGVPGVIIGHNQRIAWAVTNASVDTQDLYIIKVDPNDDTKYEVDGKTENMTVINETIRFGGTTETETIRVRVTRFGPIITDTPSYEKEDKPLALKWVATAEYGNLLGSALTINRASDWNSFRQALTEWWMPSQNFVYADVDGNIGYQLPGLMPIRAKDHSGLTPIDGSLSANDWKGYVPFEYLPHVYNPARGFIESANQIIVPPTYFEQLTEALGGQFGTDSNYVFQTLTDWGFRGQRIETLIAATDKHTIDSVKAIQMDNYNGFAAATLPKLLELDYGSDVPKEVLDWLGQWDYQEHMDKGQPALFNAFWKELSGRLWNDQLGYKPDSTVLKWSTVLMLDDPDSGWWDDITTRDKTETREDILRASLVNAYNGLVKTLGADYKTWKWGQLHTAVFVSTPLGASGIDPIESLVNGGPVPVSGGSETINRTAWSSDEGFGAESISSLRVIMDLSDFNNSQWIHSTGQSGHPASPFYRSMIDDWRLGNYDQMAWEQAAIEKVATSTTLILQPR